MYAWTVFTADDSEEIPVFIKSIISNEPYLPKSCELEKHLD